MLIPFGDIMMPSEKLHERDKTWNHVSVVSGLEDGSDGDVETDCDRTVGREVSPRVLLRTRTGQHPARVHERSPV